MKVIEGPGSRISERFNLEADEVDEAGRGG